MPPNAAKVVVMLSSSAGTGVSPGWTAIRTSRVGCNTWRSAPAAASELSCRTASGSPR